MNRESNTTPWIAIVFGSLALVAAVVAIVLTIGNANDSVSKDQVSESVNSLDGRLDKIEGDAREELSKAERRAEKRSKGEVSQAEKRSKNQTKGVQASVDKLSDQVNQLQKSVDQLSADEQANAKAIKKLQKQVKKQK